MAAKRKKSKPTKIQENYEFIAQEEYFDEDDEDSKLRIQRFLEQESVDTPEHISRSIQQSQKIEAHTEKSLAKIEDGMFPTDEYNAVSDIQSTRDMEEDLNSPDLSYEASFLSIFKKDDQTSTPHHKEKSSSQASNKRRKREKTDPPRYNCSTCKYETHRSDHFKRHLMTHSEDKPLKCTICGYSTGRSDHYKRHLQRHGMSEEKVIECCEKNGLKLKSATHVLSTEDKLAKKNGEKSKLLKDLNPGRVYKKSPGAKKYICTECGYTTDKSSHYHRHTLTHNEHRPYTCEKCNKSFKLPLYLNKHRCSKLAKRSCNMCKCIFIDRNALLEHIANEHPDGKVTDKDSNKAKKVKECSKTPNVQIKKDLTKNCSVVDQSNFFTKFSMMASDIISNKLLSPDIEKKSDENVLNLAKDITSSSKDVKPDIIKLKPAIVTNKPTSKKESINGSNTVGDGIFTTTTITEVKEIKPNIKLEVTATDNSSSAIATNKPSNNISNLEEGEKPGKGTRQRKKTGINSCPLSSQSKVKLFTLKCTKCGTWFGKLEEYYAHPCA